MNPDEKDKLYAEILKADLDAYRKIETWGASLFLGALGILAKQLVEWDLSPDQTRRIPLTTGMAILPATMGLAAFIFLRVVNFRSHKTGRKLLELAERPEQELHPSWGVLGLLLAAMPLLLGYLVSWSLSAGCSEHLCWLLWLTIAGLLTISAALVVHHRIRTSSGQANSVPDFTRIAP